MTVLSDPAVRAIVALSELRDALEQLRLQRDETRARASIAEAQRDTFRAQATHSLSP